MGKVILLEEPRRSIDVSAAIEFGRIEYAYGSSASARRCSVFRSTDFGEEVLKRLGEMGFDPGQDSLCVAGSMVPVVLLIAAAACRYEQIRVLFYNASEGRYVQRVIDTRPWKGANNGRPCEEGDATPQGVAESP